MYFRDKEELFQYLVRESTEPLLLAFRELLTRSGGDLFDAIPGLCEYLRSHKADRGLGGMGMLSAIVERNGGLQKSCLIDFLDTQAVLAQLAAAVNPDLLDIWEASDLERIVRTVLTVALPLIYDAVHTETAESREELSKTLEILRRGMGAKPAADIDKEQTYGRNDEGHAGGAECRAADCPVHRRKKAALLIAER